MISANGVRCYYLRDRQTNPHPKGKIGKDGRTVVRGPCEIDSIVLHQAGIDFADRATEEETAARALRVACHAMAFEGFVALPAPLLWYINHANALNRRSLGVEVDGLYPGLEGGRVAKGKRPSTLTDERVAAAREAVRILVTEGRQAGCPIRYIFAHRQADSWRRADPGAEIWRRVVLEYAVPVLGLETQPAKLFPHYKGEQRNGLPVPEEWDPSGRGRY